MKRVLITGENSYIGMSVEKWLKQWPDEFTVDTISVRDDAWKEFDFSSYDSVFHVAGIAHIKETNENVSLYYQVNRDLAISVATHAKDQGVKQFIFLSTMSVFGITSGKIINTSPLKPITNYGKSKLEAEEVIREMGTSGFDVAIIRPPMVYGEGAKGNYTRLVKLIRKVPVFPNYTNYRSMIHIHNLCEFIKMLITNNCSGLYHPQDSDYICTSELVADIAKKYNKRLYQPRFFNPIIKYSKEHIAVLEKMFGDLYYDKKMSQYDFEYNVKKGVDI